MSFYALKSPFRVYKLIANLKICIDLIQSYIFFDITNGYVRRYVDFKNIQIYKGEIGG
jgi:hypothetical protein